MKKFLFIIACLVIGTGTVIAQKNKTKKDEKFDRKLLCPFENGMGREPKEAFSWDPPDQKVIMISRVDTAIRSCIEGEVLSINPTEDGRFEMVVFYKEYYFWYYGISKALVNVKQQIKSGQVLGMYKFGTEMEFRMFKDEEPMDPRTFLECKVGEEDKKQDKK
jgi:hypothetical protein